MAYLASSRKKIIARHQHIYLYLKVLSTRFLSFPQAPVAVIVILLGVNLRAKRETDISKFSGNDRFRESFETFDDQFALGSWRLDVVTAR